MRNGKPFISTENVRAALDRLVYSVSYTDTNALDDLLIVTDAVSRPDFPPSSRGREYALNSLLTSAIFSHFKQIRHLYNRQVEPIDATIEQVIKQIALDAQEGSPELMGWGWFYYHYVRADLDFSQQVFSQLTHLDERTLRRYQQHTLRRLTDYLIEREQTARAAHQSRRLYNELPTQGRINLVGRTMDREAVIELIRRNSPQHIQITGTAGVGKSVLVEHIVHELIQADALEQVIWLDHPASIEFVRGALKEKFALEGTAASLRDYVSIYHTAVILDDVDHLIPDTENMERLLLDLSSTIVFLVGKTYLPIRNVAAYMLHEISQEAAYQLMETLLPSVESEQFIWQVAGGNPLAIRIAIGQLPLTSQIPLGIEPFFAAVESTLQEDEQLAWIAFTLLPSKPTAVSTLERLWPDDISAIQLATLIRNHLVEALEIPPEHCLLTHAARQYLIQRYQADVQVQSRAESLLRTLAEFPDIPIEIVEYVLLARWLYLPDKAGWQRRFWREGISKGHWGAWKSILQETSPDEFELRIAYGICLRSLGEWDAAIHVFDEVIGRAGKAGDFVLQAHAMLEGAKVLRYQGYFRRALNFLARAERNLVRQQETYLLQEVRLEQVRVSVEQKDIEVGFRILSSVPKTLASQFLWSELYLLSANYSRCRQLANDALQETVAELPVQARLHTVIGRAYEQESNLYNAQNHLFTAVSLLEQFHDPFGLGRAQSNLASVYIAMHQHYDARVLLQNAEKIQSQLKDVVGLAVTRHNLELLNEI
jgi:tetratricopeptide (TPR) repeat protein